MEDRCKERLIVATEELLRSGREASTLTVREIAKAAEVSPGLINYHCGSKDALIATAASRLFDAFSPRWAELLDAPRVAAGPSRSETDSAAVEEPSPAERLSRLKDLLKDIAKASTEVTSSADFMIRRELSEGDLSTSRFLADVLRSMAPAGTNERDLRWAAFCVVAPLQLAFLRRDWFSQWTGTDVGCQTDRDDFCDFVVDRILGSFAAEAGENGI